MNCTKKHEQMFSRQQFIQPNKQLQNAVICQQAPNFEKGTQRSIECVPWSSLCQQDRGLSPQQSIKLLSCQQTFTKHLQYNRHGTRHQKNAKIIKNQSFFPEACRKMKTGYSSLPNTSKRPNGLNALRTSSCFPKSLASGDSKGTHQKYMGNKADNKFFLLSKP